MSQVFERIILTAWRGLPPYADVICSLQLFLHFGAHRASELRESAACLAYVLGRRQRRGGRRAEKSWKATCLITKAIGKLRIWWWRQRGAYKHICCAPDSECDMWDSSSSEASWCGACSCCAARKAVPSNPDCELQTAAVKHPLCQPVATVPSCRSVKESRFPSSCRVCKGLIQLFADSTQNNWQDRVWSRCTFDRHGSHRLPLLAPLLWTELRRSLSLLIYSPLVCLKGMSQRGGDTLACSSRS